MGHRPDAREQYQVQLAQGKFRGGANAIRQTQKGIAAWNWIQARFRRRTAVDVALYFIQELPNNCKKKA